jgi:hypothetical protein
LNTIHIAVAFAAVGISNESGRVSSLALRMMIRQASVLIPK